MNDEKKDQYPCSTDRTLLMPKVIKHMRSWTAYGPDHQRYPPFKCEVCGTLVEIPIQKEQRICGGYLCVRELRRKRKARWKKKKG